MNSPVVGKRAHTAESGWQKQSVCVLFSPPLLPSKGALQGLLTHQGSCFMSRRVSTSACVFHQGRDIFQLFLLKQFWLINLCWYADITELHWEHCSLTKTSELHWSYQRVGPSPSNLHEISSLMHCYKSQESPFSCRKMFKVPVMHILISIKYKARQFLKK